MSFDRSREEGSRTFGSRATGRRATQAIQLDEWISLAGSVLMLIGGFRGAPREVATSVTNTIFVEHDEDD